MKQLESIPLNIELCAIRVNGSNQYSMIAINIASKISKSWISIHPRNKNMNNSHAPKEEPSQVLQNLKIPFNFHHFSQGSIQFSPFFPHFFHFFTTKTHGPRGGSQPPTAHGIDHVRFCAPAAPPVWPLGWWAVQRPPQIRPPELPEGFLWSIL